MRAHPAGAAFPDTPPPARTGGFGEQTCRACHFDGELNAAGGTFSISGIPERYTPGQTYRLTISLQRTAMQAGGFELAARFAAGDSAGRQAGTLRASDERAQVKTAASGIQYASHTRPGIQLTAEGRIAWVLEWTAPESAAGDVVFHAAANAANDDNSPLGDFIYTTADSSRSR
ncbi:MAG TPA: choice-of-anchor V domain-containing protein [Longimicrobiaceae bacterium]